MKMSFRILAGAAFFIAATAAFALRGKLEKPGLAYPEGYPARQQVMDALNRPGSVFLDGSFINARTMLRYCGNTRALNQFLDDLVKCPGSLLSVSFAREEEGDWQLEHEGMQFSPWGTRFQESASL